MTTTTTPDKGQLLIGGAFTDARSGRTFPTVNPADESVLTTVAEAGAEDVDAAVAAARAALTSGPWSRMTGAERGRILWKMGELMIERLPALSLLETLDTGKTLFDSGKIEIPMAAQILQYYAGAASKIDGRTLGGRPDAFTFTLKEPVGVVAAIVPWNFPLLLATWKVAPALAAGCVVLLKPASQTPLTAIELGRIGLDAGLPPGVLQVLPGSGGNAGMALVRHPGVDKVAFTGSTEVGRTVLREAAGTMKRVTLELGGKSPNIVFADADMDATVQGVANAIFQNAGQTCSAGSRLLVERRAKDGLVERLAKRATTMRVGPGVSDPDMGPIISKRQLETIEQYVDVGRKEGARVAAGGARPKDASLGGGFYFQPTLLDHVTPDMRVAQEEIFGPVLAIIDFDDVEEAVALANRSDYGLVAGVWTRDINKAMALATRIKAGQVYVNTYGAGGGVELPFGGYKKSGYGREKGLESLASYTQVKNVCIKFL